MSTKEEVYSELNFPSKKKLAIALRARQIPFTQGQLEDLTRSNEVNQIYVRLPNTKGKSLLFA